MIPPKIVSQINSLNDRAASLERKAAACRQAAISLAEAYDEEEAAQAEEQPAELHLVTPIPKHTQSNGTHLPVTRSEWIERILMESGRGMKVPEIVDALIANGQGGDLRRNILYNATATALKRKEERFRRDEEGYWSLIEKDDAE